MNNSSLPLLDLHRHLDGNIRSQTILELGQQFNIEMPADDLESLRPYVQIIDNEPNLLGFLQKLDWGVKVLGDLDACKRVAYENMLDAAAQGLDYVELRFSPFYMARSHQLNVADVVAAVVDGINAASKEVAVKAKLIGILSRTFGIDACQTELDGLLAHKQQLIAIDLAGDELGFPGNLFEPHFKQARDAGLNITVHAGEAAGSESIWHAIEHLGATRIGHGVKAVEDNHLLDYLRDHKIGVESCLTSNIQTSTVPSLASHPLKQFLDHGILATINTDDPGVSNIEIHHEFDTAAPAAGLTRNDIYKAQKNALEIAFLTPNERKALLASGDARNDN